MSDISRNWTPTFRLTPIEKPDMSPYLFHMTTSENLKLILEDEPTKKEGKLKVQIPRHSKKNTYDIKMVCFTDSPPFALDFFRYRWSKNKNSEVLKYGIGFDKETMIKKGVFPTFYVSKQLQAQILNLNKKFKNNLEDKLECLSCDNKVIIPQLKKVLNDTSKTLSSVERLMFPLLEDEKFQGYIWEREWRYTTPNNSDFIFSYDDIRIICCVDEDENHFKQIIGEKYIEKNPIKFIRTWQQYDEITDFLNRKTQNINNINDNIKETLTIKKGVDRYIDYLENLERRISKLKELREGMSEELKKIALIKIFERISKIQNPYKDLKVKIMESDCETVINAIAYYQYQKNKNTVRYPQKYLSDAIKNKWSTKDSNYEEIVSEIRKEMEEICKIL